MSDINIPLLRKAVEWVEAEAAKAPIDREWDQSMWVRTPEQRAASLLVDEDQSMWSERNVFAKGMIDQLEPYCGTTYCVAGYICEITGNGERAQQEGWSDLAANLLGMKTNALSEYELFEASNSAAEVRQIAERLAGEKL